MKSDRKWNRTDPIHPIPSHPIHSIKNQSYHLKNESQVMETCPS
ncbi:hypothetical protein [Leptospira jelokensis]|nr:hypothetical protein [Leptospira jelokensis]